MEWTPARETIEGVSDWRSPNVGHIQTVHPPVLWNGALCGLLINWAPRRSAAVAFTYRLTPWRPALSLTLWADRSNVGAFQL